MDDFRLLRLGDTLRKDQQANGVPPHWGIYIAVENAELVQAV